MKKKSKKFKVACIQMTSKNNMDHNILEVSKKINNAKKLGADLVILPENVFYMNKNFKGLIKNSYEEKKHPGIIEMMNISLNLKIFILLGSVCIKNKRNFFNRSILIGPNGKIIKRYDKIHLFTAKLPDGSTYNEKKFFKSGKNISIYNLPWGKIGMTICYDLRFPYLYRKLAQQNVSFISVPSAFTLFTGKLHWHTLLKARAIENACYIFAPAQSGKHPGNIKTFGHSLIVDPWGRIICDNKNKDKIFVKEIDPSIVNEARQSIPSLNFKK